MSSGVAGLLALVTAGAQSVRFLRGRCKHARLPLLYLPWLVQSLLPAGEKRSENVSVPKRQRGMLLWARSQAVALTGMTSTDLNGGHTEGMATARGCVCRESQPMGWDATDASLWASNAVQPPTGCW